MKMRRQESVEHSKGSPKRKVYSYQCLHQKVREISNKQSDGAPQTQKNKKKPIQKEVDGKKL
jgi:hypothetical protein